MGHKRVELVEMARGAADKTVDVPPQMLRNHLVKSQIPVSRQGEPVQRLLGTIRVH